MTIDIEHWKEICKGPGKFEAGGPETPYFYDRRQEGDGEEILVDGYAEDEDGLEIVYEGPSAALFELTEEEREVFELDGKVTLLWEDSHGFVYSQDFATEWEAELWFQNLYASAY